MTISLLGSATLQNKLSLLEKLRFPSAQQIMTGLDKAIDALNQASVAVGAEIKRKGTTKFAATVLANAGTTMVFKSAALATFGTAAPTVLGVTAAAMIGRGGLELTKFGYKRFQNYYNGVSQPALLSYETANEFKAIGSKASFGLSDAISFLAKNWRQKSLSELFTGSAQQIGISGAVSFLGVGAGLGLGMSGAMDISAANAASPEEVAIFMEEARTQPLNDQAQAAFNRIEENPDNSQAYKDLGHALFNGPHVDIDLAYKFYDHAADLGNTQAIRDLPFVAQAAGYDLPLVEEIPVQAAIITPLAEDIEPLDSANVVEQIELPAYSEYSVQTGDTLWNIVKSEYGLTSNNEIALRIEEIKALNDFSDHDAGNLAESQIIRLPSLEVKAPETNALGEVRPMPRPVLNEEELVVEPEELPLIEQVQEIPLNPIRPDVVNDFNFIAFGDDADLQFTMPETIVWQFQGFGLGSTFDTDNYYLGEVEYTVGPGDGLWRIFTHNYDTDGLTNTEIQGYVDSLAQYNAMNGAEAGNLEIGDTIKLPDIKLLNPTGEFTQNWFAMDQQAQIPSSSVRSTSCAFTIAQNTVTADASCDLRPGDTFQIRPVDLFPRPSLS